MSPSLIRSSTPVTTTVWGRYQLAGVNVSDGVDIAPSERSLDDSGIATLAVGCELRTMVKVAVPPASVVVNPAVGLMLTPAVSSSVLVTEMSAGLRPP